MAKHVPHDRSPVHPAQFRQVEGDHARVEFRIGPAERMHHAHRPGRGSRRGAACRVVEGKDRPERTDTRHVNVKVEHRRHGRRQDIWQHELEQHRAVVRWSARSMRRRDEVPLHNTQLRKGPCHAGHKRAPVQAGLSDEVVGYGPWGVACTASGHALHVRVVKRRVGEHVRHVHYRSWNETRSHREGNSFRSQRCHGHFSLTSYTPRRRCGISSCPFRAFA